MKLFHIFFLRQILQNCDELFEREEFSAAPDVSWPDCFNSGVFVYRPSQATFDKIVEFAIKNGSFDGGDQGLLNQYFSDWATSDIQKRLPFLYNVTAYASYCYLPAFKQFRDKIKILHFAGKMKPWLITFNSQTKVPSVPTDYAHAADLIQLWWNIFFDNVHSNLNDQMVSLIAFSLLFFYFLCFFFTNFLGQFLNTVRSLFFFYHVLLKFLLFFFTLIKLLF